MCCTVRRLAIMFAIAASFAVVQSAQAAVTILNLSNEVIYYSKGYKEGNLWYCKGWYSIASGKKAELSSGTYYRFLGANTRTIYYDEPAQNSSGSFWHHPVNGFSTAEGATNASEVYRDGVRTTTAKLTSAGFTYSKFRRYTDGKTLKFGNYWTLASIDKSFSHSSSGTKSQTFSHLNNRIISHKVSVSSSRGVAVGPHWFVNDRSVDLRVTLQGGPVYDPWSPSYKGIVTLNYIY